MLDAQEALRLGIFNRVVPHDRLEEETTAYATMLAQKPPLALARAKQAVYGSLDRSLTDQLDVELRHQLECFVSDDAREGLHAFLEKRPPIFKGF